jgi:Helix-turn-helix domain
MAQKKSGGPHEEGHHRGPLAFADPAQTVPPQGSDTNREPFAMIPEALMRDRSVPRSAVVLYGVLARYGSVPEDCFPSLARLARDLKCSRRSIQRWLNALDRAGWIERERRLSTAGDFDSNGYRLARGVGTEMSLPRDTDVPTGGDISVTGVETQMSHERESLNESQLNEKHTRAADGAEEGAPVDVSVTLGSDATAFVVENNTGRILGPATSDYSTAPMVAATTRRSAAMVADVGFEQFWTHWPRKVAKRAAAKAWAQAIRRATPADIIEGVRRYVADPNLPEPSFIPYPASWLSADRWLDEPEPVRKKSTKTARNRERLAKLARSNGSDGSNVIDVSSWNAS